MPEYSPPQVERVGDVRATTQGSGNYLSESNYGYMGWYSLHHDTPDSVAPLPPRE